MDIGSEHTGLSFAELLNSQIRLRNQLRALYLGCRAHRYCQYSLKRHHDGGVDRSLRAIFAMPNDITSSIYCDFSLPNSSILGPVPFSRWLRLPSVTIKVTGEGEICIENFILPATSHCITITKRNETKIIKAYTGEKLINPAKGDA